MSVILIVIIMTNMIVEKAPCGLVHYTSPPAGVVPRDLVIESHFCHLPRIYMEYDIITICKKSGKNLKKQLRISTA